MEKYKPLSKEEERIGKLIVNAAFKVHKALGPDLLEKIYETSMKKPFTNKKMIIMRVPSDLNEKL